MSSTSTRNSLSSKNPSPQFALQNTTRIHLLFVLVIMATRLSLTRSLQPVCSLKPHHTKTVLRLSKSPSYSRHFHKSHPCPLWSSSFSICLLHINSPKSLSNRKPIRSCSISSTLSQAPAMAASTNPLLNEFYFPPFDSIHADHVRPGIRALLEKLVCYSTLIL